MPKLYQPAELCQEVKRGGLIGERVSVVFRISPVAENGIYAYHPGYPSEKVPTTIRMSFREAVTGRVERVSGVVSGVQDNVVELKGCYVEK